MAYDSRSFGNEWAEVTFDQTQSPGQDEPNRSIAKRFVMKKSVAEQASPALNGDGVTGSPISSGNSIETSMAAAKSFTDELRHRAIHPLRESDEYRQIVAECVAAHKARTNPSQCALSSFEWNPRLVATIVFILIILSTIVWTGCRVTNAAASAIGNHAAVISKDLSD